MLSPTNCSQQLARAGYIGGAVLERLLKHPSASTFDITALVRNEDKARILESKFPVKVVRGTHQDFDKLEALAENAHVVYHCVGTLQTLQPT